VVMRVRARIISLTDGVGLAGVRAAAWLNGEPACRHHLVDRELRNHRGLHGRNDFRAQVRRRGYR